MTNELKKTIIDFEKTLDNTLGLTPAQFTAIQVSVMKIVDVIEKELKEHEQYKKIEEELGIDLITLFKALKNGVYAFNIHLDIH